MFPWGNLTPFAARNHFFGPMCSKQIVSHFFHKEIGETWLSPLVHKEVASPCVRGKAWLKKFFKDYRK